MNEVKEEKNCQCQDRACGDECKCKQQAATEPEVVETDTKKEKKKKNKEIEALQESIAKLTADNKALLSKLQYSQAELINYRKRKEEETIQRLKYANQDIIQEMIPILDNFERAIKLDDNDLTDELSKFLQGFKMMYASLSDVLKKYGVEEIECLHQPFDPMKMEALMMDSDPNFANDEVIEVLLKGYTLKGRIIRPASVKVNKIEENENNEGEDKNE